jgi:hypothetical protein
MLAILAAATMATASPAGESLSPAEAVLRQQTMRQILANPARYCKQAALAQTPAGEPAPLRCRPAPYYVSGRGERMKPERLVMTGSRVPMGRDDRRPRPCLLMEGPAPSAAQTRVAD